MKMEKNIAIFLNTLYIREKNDIGSMIYLS